MKAPKKASIRMAGIPALLVGLVLACQSGAPGGSAPAANAGPSSATATSSVGSPRTSSRPSAASPAMATATAVADDLASVAARLHDDVAWLADDAREGRRAGTRGADDSAAYLAAHFAELGLEPAGEDGWFQELVVPLDPRDGGGSRVELHAADPVEGFAELSGAAELAPLFCSSGGTVTGSLAWGGYGITLDGDPRSWSSYGDEDLTGRVVLLVRGVPHLAEDEAAPAGSGANDPHAPVDPHAGAGAGDTGLVSRDAGWGNAGSLFGKVMSAKRRGAAAVIVAQHPDEAGEPILRFDAGAAAQASIPALMISAGAAAKLDELYEQRVRAIDAAGKPWVELDGARAEPALPFASNKVKVFADVHRDTAPTRNVLARLRGRGEGPTVLVGAHYDHLGRGGSGSLAPSEQGQIHNGADDNASGTAAVLEMARRLAAAPQPPPGDVIFALWSGEELGLLGSEHWAKHPTVPLDEIGMNLNLDMVGRAGDGVLQVLGAGTSPAFAGWMEDAGRAAGLELRVSLSGQGVGGSDHQTFLKREIPALHFFSGVHTDYHKPSDDTERFEAGGAARVVALGLDLVDRAQHEHELPFVAHEPDESEQQVSSAGWSVWFGSVPDYAFDGPGLRLTGTSAGSPAERAGFLEGDVISQFGDVAIDNIYDFVYALQVYKPGNVVLVKYERDGEPLETRVTLVPRGLQ